MDHIKDLLPKHLKKRGLFDHAKASQIALHAQEWIIREFKDLQDQLLAKSYKDQILLISAANSIASQELNQRITELKSHLIDDFGHEIREIRIIRSK